MATTLPHPVTPCSHALSTFKSLPPDAAGSWFLFNYSKRVFMNIQLIYNLSEHLHCSAVSYEDGIKIANDRYMYNSTNCH